MASGHVDLAHPQVEKILDIQFKYGKQYLAKLANIGEPQWMSHRKLGHAADAIEAFEAAQLERLDSIVNSPFKPEVIYGHETDLETGKLLFHVRWQNTDECHAVSADAIYRKYPMLAIRYFQASLVVDAASQLAGEERLYGDTRLPKSALEDIPYVEYDDFYDPLRIVGCWLPPNSGDLLLLMEWSDDDQTDFVLAEDANQKCPQIVIEYYEKLLSDAGNKLGL